jgi:hypothetical protein
LHSGEFVSYIEKLKIFRIYSYENDTCVLVYVTVALESQVAICIRHKTNFFLKKVPKTRPAILTNDRVQTCNLQITIFTFTF